MRRFILSLLIAMALPSCRPTATSPSASKAAPDRAFDELLGLMRHRLEMMHEVARYKWMKNTPIDDPDREVELLRDVADRGVALGLDPGTTRAFVRAQIEAAKALQRADFRRWEGDHRGPEGNVPDLSAVLRPRIDALNRKLLDELAKVEARPREDRPSSAEISSRAAILLTGEGIDTEVRAAAILPLLQTAR